MVNGRNIVLLSILSLHLASCTQSNNGGLPTYSVQPKPFVNSIDIDGVVEPVSFTTIATPLDIEGTIAYIIDDGTMVQAGELICTIESPGLQTHYDQMLVELEKTEAELEKRTVEMGLEYALMEAQVKNNETSAKISELDSLQLQYSPATQRRITELELRRVEIEKRRTEQKMKTLQVVQQTEVLKLEMYIARTKDRVQSIKNQIESLNLRAPVSGLVVREINRNTDAAYQVGDNVWSGLAVASIPEMENMKVKIQAAESDFKQINVGDSVIYSFDAMPNNVAFGRITGKTPIGRPINRGSSVRFFEIEASVDSCTKLPEPGFTARCTILLAQLNDTIVVPQIAVFNRDSIKVVYAKRKHGIDMLEVETGISSPKETVISRGLAANEEILLDKPRESSIKKRILLPKDSSTTQQPATEVRDTQNTRDARDARTPREPRGARGARANRTSNF